MSGILNNLFCCLVRELPTPVKYFLRSLLIFMCIMKDEDDVGGRKINNQSQLPCLEGLACNNIDCCDYSCYSFEEGYYFRYILGVIVSVTVFFMRWILFAIILLPFAILVIIWYYYTYFIYFIRYYYAYFIYNIDIPLMFCVALCIVLLAN